MDTISVDDIIQNSNADKLHIYLALFELKQSGFLKVVECEELGAPLIVRKKKVE
jgi:hypothetical protein